MIWKISDLFQISHKTILKKKHTLISWDYAIYYFGGCGHRSLKNSEGYEGLLIFWCSVLELWPAMGQNGGGWETEMKGRARAVGEMLQGLINFSVNGSVQFSRSVMSDSLGPHELQHLRPPCPSPTPRVHSDSRPSSQWCHPAISSSVIPFSSWSLPASESFLMSQLFAWGGQSTGVSALASFLPKNTQGWSPLEWTGWISMQSKGLSRVFSNTTVQKHFVR